MRIFLIEDDVAVGTAVMSGLQEHGQDLQWFQNGSDGLTAAKSSAPDLVLLDLGLPDIDGVDICRTLTQELGIAVIVISARDAELDRVLLLEMGADDYLVKPFGIRELLARVRAVHRRSEVSARIAAKSDHYEVGQLRVEPSTRRAFLAGSEISLTPKEFDLLDYLAREPGVARDRAAIIREVWGFSWYGTTKTIDAHVASIRRKLNNPKSIEAVRSIGFRLGDLE